MHGTWRSRGATPQGSPSSSSSLLLNSKNGGGWHGTQLGAITSRQSGDRGPGDKSGKQRQVPRHENTALLTHWACGTALPSPPTPATSSARLKCRKRGLHGINSLVDSVPYLQPTQKGPCASFPIAFLQCEHFQHNFLQTGPNR